MKLINENKKLLWLPENSHAKIYQLNELTDDIVQKTSSVFCFVFHNNRLLMVQNKNLERKLEIVGGHVEKNETPLQTIKREAQEEGSVKINNASVIGAYMLIHNDEHLKYPSGQYQVFYASNIESILPFNADEEILYRTFLTKEECLETQWVKENKELYLLAMDWLSKK